MSDYPNRPRPQGGWPAQPPQYTPGGQQPGSSWDQQPTQPGYSPERSAYQSGQSRYQSGPPVRPRRRRRRGRGWIALLVTLLVLVGAFVIVDQVTKAYAENMLASKIQTQAKLGHKPSVTIQGWPFLTQVASHNVHEVDISASNVQAGKVDITSITAKATGVHINSSFNGATIDHITGRVLISFQSLESLFQLPSGATLSADPAAGPNAVQLTASVLGIKAGINGTVTQISPNEIELRLGSLSGIASLFSGALPPSSQVITIPQLPAGLVVTGITVTSQGIQGSAAASNTTISGSSGSLGG